MPSIREIHQKLNARLFVNYVFLGIPAVKQQDDLVLAEHRHHLVKKICYQLSLLVVLLSHTAYPNGTAR